jgi:hypothetical protein
MLIMNLNRKLVTKEDLLKVINDIDVFKFYTGKDVVMGSRMSSPLREDKNPSFGYFIGSSGEICFKDFVSGAGDCIKFVQLLFDLNFFEALSKIVIDFKLTDQFLCKELPRTSNDLGKKQDRDNLLKTSSQLTIGKRRREFTAKDYAYWLKFGIDSDTLKKYNVEAIDYLFLNQKPFYLNKFAYAYVENKDGKESYKIYQPFNEEFKWLNNHNDSVWQGWTQLPASGKELIITKSLKDVMAIDAVYGMPVVSLQSESVAPKEHIINELKDRFHIIYVLYDNDFDKEQNWGRILGDKLAIEHDLIQIEIPTSLRSKDFSDLVAMHGADTAKRVLDHLIDVPF